MIPLLYATSFHQKWMFSVKRYYSCGIYKLFHFAKFYRAKKKFNTGSYAR